MSGEPSVPGPDPYRARTRVLKMRPDARRKLLRLEVWCEQNRHTPVRVFRLREGMLVLCRSDADVRDMQAEHPHLDDWSRRRAFFLEEWVSAGDPDSRLQVVCDCRQTEARLVDVGRLAGLIPAEGERTRRVTLAEILAPEA